VWQIEGMGITLVRGSDEALVSEKVSEIVRSLVGDADRTMVLQEFSGDFIMAAATEAARTPSMFSDRRVIVINQPDMKADDVAVLVDYIERPDGDTDLVIEWGTGRLPAPLQKALAAAGGTVVDPSPPNKGSKSADRIAWWQNEVRSRGLDLEPSAFTMLVEWLGEDVGRLDGIATTLISTFGKARIGVLQLRPFLGQEGDVQPWDLTDAIDKGDTAGALRAARRMMAAGDRHPLQLMAQLHNHYERLARLDGHDPRSEADVERITGQKGFPAKKALGNYRSLGHDGLLRAFELLARADSDLRGGTGLDDDVVMDVLIARLSRIAPGVSRRR